jgi:hypothetical protein
VVDKLDEQSVPHVLYIPIQSFGEELGFISANYCVVGVDVSI